MNVHSSVLGLIGKTPLVKLNAIAHDIPATIYVKLESRNPGGSVKDRIGIAMLEAAERDGLLKPGGIIIEPTSGNTGIGLALAATLKGYKCLFVMTDKASPRTRALSQSTRRGCAHRVKCSKGQLAGILFQYRAKTRSGNPECSDAESI